MTFDVSQFELEDTGYFTVLNAKGDDDLLVDGNPVIIRMYGSGSDQAVKANRKEISRTTARTKAMFTGKPPPNDAENAEREGAEKLAAVTASIENFPVEGGALALYRNPKLGYITKQAAKFFADDANFPKGL